MARILSLHAAALAAFVGLSAPAAGFWWGDNCEGCAGCCPTQGKGAALSAIDYCHAITGVNQRWPSPYLCPDRASAHAPFNVMVTNGWRRQNLMGGHHFNHDSSRLTQAGELKIQWIMTQAPPEYRRMFVERSVDPDVTKTRIDTINEYAERLARNEPAPQVQETHIISEGRPAGTVDFVNTQFRENMRTPMLPISTGGDDE